MSASSPSAHRIGLDPAVSLTVVIPHRNDPARLSRCLAALAPQCRPGAEVIVVDDGSDAVPQVPAWVRLVRQAPAGAAVARNRGVAAARGRTLAFLDADCLPAPDYMARAAGAERVTAGRIAMFDEGAAGLRGRRSGAQAFETALAFDQPRSVRKGWAATANLVVPRGVFDTVGPFRAGVAEDVDWCRRARAQGYRVVYDGTLSVWHPTRATGSALGAKWRRVTEEGFALAREAPAGRLRWALRIPLVAAGAVPDFLRILRCPALVGAERGVALGMVVRIRALRVGWMVQQVVRRDVGSVRPVRRQVTKV